MAVSESVYAKKSENFWVFSKISVILIDNSDKSDYNDKCEAHKQYVLCLFVIGRAETGRGLRAAASLFLRGVTV